MIRKYFTQRYPLEDNKWKIIIPISLFIVFFMVIFQPFGLDEVQIQYKFLFLGGFGLVTFAILMLNLVILPALFPALFQEEKWTVMKELLHFLLIIFLIGLGNLLYTAWALGMRLTFINILVFQVFTLSIGIIPITVLTLLKQNYLKRKNRESAEYITSTLITHDPHPIIDEQVRIASENDREEVMMMISDLLFVKSEGNYITVGYLKNGKITSVLLRNTMKYAMETLSAFPIIFRCHRSWLVNLDRIKKVSGNSQGLRLSIENYTEEIPVARNFSAEIRQRLTQKSD